jgi:3'-5' exoribonuclease
MPAKKQFLKRLQEDQQVADIFVVLHKQLSAGRTGRNYLRVTLGDKTGQIETRVWEGADEMAARFEQGDLVFVNGVVTSYQGILQIKAQYIENLEESDADKVDWADFLPCSVFDLDEMWTELVGLLSKVRDPNIARLLASFTSDKQFQKRFTRATAAKMMHHAYVGGLLEHTLGCVRMAGRIGPLYPINCDLLIAGAFLHDIGKFEELSDGAGFEYTDEGRLLGHIIQGILMLKERIATLENFPADIALHLEHLVVSHHGENEWGAPKRPKTPEALMLHAIDNIDAKLAAALAAIDSEDGPRGDWTTYVRLFDRPLYRGKVAQVEPDNSDADAGAGEPGGNDTTTAAKAAVAGEPAPEEAPKKPTEKPAKKPAEEPSSTEDFEEMLRQSEANHKPDQGKLF